MDERDAATLRRYEQEGVGDSYERRGMGDEVLAVAYDTGEIGVAFARLQDEGERLVAAISQAHDRFHCVLGPEQGAIAELRDSRPVGDSDMARTVNGMADLIQRQVERVHEMNARCAL